MTKKRFVLTSEKIGKHWEILITDYQTDEPFDDTSYDATDNYQDTLDNMEDLCLLLNQIHKENEQLKLQYKELEISLLNNQLAYNDLEKENEQLKKQIGNLEHTRDFCADVCADCERLEEENEQLKKELFEIRKDYILETYADNPIRRDEKLKALEKVFMNDWKTI